MRMRSMGFIGYMVEIRCATRFTHHKLEGKHHMKDLGINERTIIK
jgi:hypothetical protein